MATQEAVARTGQRATGRRAPALVAICVAQLMVILDSSIVNVALPSMQRALDFSPGNLAWVINAYTLAFGGLLLLGGRIGDLFGRRRMFLVGIAVFAAASLAMGLYAAMSGIGGVIGLILGGVLTGGLSWTSRER